MLHKKGVAIEMMDLIVFGAKNEWTWELTLTFHSVPAISCTKASQAEADSSLQS